MQVVKREEVHILHMPGKRALPHSKVEIGSVDPGYINPHLITDVIKDVTQLIYIPILVEIRIMVSMVIMDG